MTLDTLIKEAFHAGAESIIDRIRAELPRIVGDVLAAGNPDERLTIPAAAEALSLGERAVRNRIRDGLLPTIEDGGRKYILRRDIHEYNRRLADKAQFERDQQQVLTSDIDPDIAEALGVRVPPRSRTAKKAHR